MPPELPQISEPATSFALKAGQTIVDWMVKCSAAVDSPSRIVDPGTGSGRYLLTAARQFPGSQLIGVEIDPLPAMLARANLAVAGFGDRSQIILNDFRAVTLPGSGKTLFIGNPPYVRHHLLDAYWKEWLTAEATKRGYSASQLAGLHVHFFMATVAKASKGDFGPPTLGFGHDPVVIGGNDGPGNVTGRFSQLNGVCH